MRRRGFSLIELLVAISIIGVLAGLGWNMAKRARQMGYNVGCQANLTRLTGALSMYANNYRDAIPIGHVRLPADAASDLRQTNSNKVVTMGMGTLIGAKIISQTNSKVWVDPVGTTTYSARAGDVEWRQLAFGPTGATKKWIPHVLPPPTEAKYPGQGDYNPGIAYARDFAHKAVVADSILANTDTSRHTMSENGVNVAYLDGTVQRLTNKGTWKTNVSKTMSVGQLVTNGKVILAWIHDMPAAQTDPVTGKSSTHWPLSTTIDDPADPRFMWPGLDGGVSGPPN